MLCCSMWFFAAPADLVLGKTTKEWRLLAASILFCGDGDKDPSGTEVARRKHDAKKLAMMDGDYDNKVKTAARRLICHSDASGILTTTWETREPTEWWRMLALRRFYPLRWCPHCTSHKASSPPPLFPLFFPLPRLLDAHPHIPLRF